jgi:hypothetical protein
VRYDPTVRLGRLIAVAAVAVLAACGGAGGGAKPATAARSGTCDVSATWTGSAVDPSGVPWQVLLVLHHDGATVVGTAEWTTEGGRFVEDVTGAVDCATGVVTLRTPNFAADDATAMVASYRLELSADDRTVTGSWDSGSGQPGTLQATRK